MPSSMPAPSTPGAFPSQLKLLIDRHLCLVRGFEDPETAVSHIDGTRAGVLITCAWPTGEGNTDIVEEAFKRTAAFLMMEPKAKLVADGLSGPDQLSDEHREQAREFARQLVG